MRNKQAKTFYCWQLCQLPMETKKL